VRRVCGDFPNADAAARAVHELCDGVVPVDAVAVRAHDDGDGVAVVAEVHTAEAFEAARGVLSWHGAAPRESTAGR